jgi:hypothetical protein
VFRDARTIALLARLRNLGIAVNEVVQGDVVELSAIHPSTGHLIIVRRTEGFQANKEWNCALELSKQLGHPWD